jgi:predicted component of type VI protein secretion system
MDDRLADTHDSAHALQGPHRELCAEPPPGFVPLRLVLAPSGLQFDLTWPEVLLGRHSEADVRLAAPEISRRHCRIFFTDGVWKVMDLSSLNGLYVNDTRMHEAPLYHGDRLRVGPFNFLVEYLDKQNQMLRKIADVLPRQAS